MKAREMKRQVVGVVVSNKMDKTVVVAVERTVKHAMYHKYIKRRAKFAAGWTVISPPVPNTAAMVQSATTTGTSGSITRRAVETVKEGTRLVMTMR